MVSRPCSLEVRPAMVTYLTRRLLSSALVVAVSTFLMYVLVDLAIDPLEDLRISTAPNRDQLIANRIARLNLDDPVVVRYLDWAQGAGGCLVGQCDLGINFRTNQEVTSLIAGAIGTTMLLVTASAILAIFLGVAVGIVSALRQYSGFDYSSTFVSFLFYSLPVFWVAVLAKEFLAIQFNDFLADPTIGVLFIVIASALVGLAVSAGVGGDRRRRLITFGASAAIIAALLVYIDVADFLVTPSLGLPGVALGSLGAAVGITALSTGLRNRRALYAALTVAGIGIALWYPMFFVWAALEETIWRVLGLGVVAVLVGIAVGFAWGGPDKGASARTAAITALPVATLLFLDRVLRSWPDYVDELRGRPIATTSRSTPNLDGDFWITSIDTFTHLLLPSITLLLISFAGYTRYSRASMLETMNADYIRTARAKGLNERTVVMRHAFRNALLPLASVVPVDIITLAGGAVITESIFSWFGMGKLFVDSLNENIIDPVMAFILVVGILAVVANFVADLAYAVLDPRIRVS
ncbi:ABC transporter permease [Nocardioidaceae bacterium]|nr:ABC transporter permease [Nocardioidaceae bacterium]